MDPTRPGTAELVGEVRFKALPQGTVLLAFHVSQAFQVNRTASEILNRVREPTPVMAVIEQLAAKYGIDKSEIAGHVLAFLEECAKLGLVRLSEVDVGGQDAPGDMQGHGGPAD